MPRNNEQERRVTNELVEAYKNVNDKGARVASEGATADFVVETDVPGQWVGVQVKTANLSSVTSIWQFSHVHGYERMPVVLFRADKNDGTIVSGTTLERCANSVFMREPLAGQWTLRGESFDVMGTDDLARKLYDLVCEPNSAFHVMRYDSWFREFPAGSAHNREVELDGIEAYKSAMETAFPLVAFQRPEDEMTPVDLVERRGPQGEIRIQFKTARWRRTKSGAWASGLTSDLCHGARGHRRPYHQHDFDMLVVVAWVGEKPFFWRIPMEELVDAKLVATNGGEVGKQIFGVHSGHGGINPRVSQTAKYFWTADYFYGDNFNKLRSNLSTSN